MKSKKNKQGKKVNEEVALNKEAAIKYNKIIDITDRHRMWECSDGTILDLFGIKHHVRKNIAHLSEDEQVMVLRKYDRFSKLKSELGALKRQSYGTRQEGWGMVLEARKAEVLEMFGMYYSTEEIHKKLLEDGLVLNIHSLHRFRNKYRLEIEKLQADYDKEYGTIGVARKRSRLEQLDFMLRRLRQEFDDAIGKNMLPYGREIIKVLEQARKEVEGEQVHLNVDGSINIATTIESAKSVEQLYSDINFMTLLIARVAARMHVSPMLIQHQLINSWYARFSGLKRNDNLMNETPDYPSKIILNWGELKNKAKKKEQEHKELKEKFKDEETQEIESEDVEEISEIRRKVIQKLKTKQKYIDDTKTRLSGQRKTKRDIQQLIKEIKEEDKK